MATGRTGTHTEVRDGIAALENMQDGEPRGVGVKELKRMLDLLEGAYDFAKWCPFKELKWETDYRFSNDFEERVKAARDAREMYRGHWRGALHYVKHGKDDTRLETGPEHLLAMLEMKDRVLEIVHSMLAEFEERFLAQFGVILEKYLAGDA